MMKKLEIQILGIKSFNDKLKLETEIDVLEGVKDSRANERTETLVVEFDDNLISKEEIFEKIKKLGYKIKEISLPKASLGEFVYYVKGMHCASCELLIERELLKIKNIRSVEASVSKGTVRIVYQGERPKIQRLNSIFKKYGYTFFEKPIKLEKTNYFTNVLLPAVLVIFLFFALKNSPLASLVNVTSSSSLPTFFFFGLFAGFSTCAALVGGLLLSLAKQWGQIYAREEKFLTKLQPYLLFNLGRILSFALLGGIIGLVGAKIKFSLGFTAILILLVSLLMVALGLQMLGIKYFQKFQITLPRFITRKIADEKNFQGKFMPILMGAFTFFLPCGFTLTAQSLALISGSFWQGAAIMFFFALGTAVGLLAIGFSSVKFLEKPHLSEKFLKVAGTLVLFFAFYNFNAQLNVLGLPSLSDLKLDSFAQAIYQKNSFNDKDLPPIVNGKQIIKMKASRYGYEPNYFKVRVGIPVRWEIEDVGTSGCTNAIVAKGLFPDEIPLTPGKVSVKEFTPTRPGKYKFSCWMGMVSGIIEVVEKKGSSSNSNSVLAANNQNDVILSGALGCSCGRGSCQIQR
jgi:sulfite exporter TauE/SafE/copper chaperone CopZ/plastocyanin